LPHLGGILATQATNVEIDQHGGHRAIAQGKGSGPQGQIDPRRLFMRLCAPIGMGNAHGWRNVGAGNTRV
jgi:hypothetical protein